MNSDKPSHIIAIGASAGGMEEINSFFDHTPLDGVSYIIIQHLSSDFKSRMVELLSRHSKLVVKEAENEMKVQKNVVYLIPNTKFMTISGSTLYLTEKETVKGPHLTINKFFISLAVDAGAKAIAIVLSGLGSDGTEGVRAVKHAGGMVIARNPETTEFGSMPSSAVATGMVDFILEPGEMPATIEKYLAEEEKGTLANASDEKIVQAIVELIRSQLPLDFTDYKQSTILRRIKRRALTHDIQLLEKYLDFLKTRPEEVEALAKDFLISVTSFFRDPEAFKAIKVDVLPKLIERLLPGDDLKVWVAGCATGEEAYSLAILLYEVLGTNPKNLTAKIFATDIDTAALKVAGAGLFAKSIVKDVSKVRLDSCFVSESSGYRVIPAIRSMVIFATHDVIKNPPYCNMDIISCRNMLIYMTPVLQRKIFLLLLFGLKKEGCLFLGSSENPLPIIDQLEVVEKKWKIYKSIKTNRAVRFDAFSLPELVDTKRHVYSGKEDVSLYTTSLDEAVSASLIDKFGVLVICIDSSNQVIKSYGNTVAYIIHQDFNRDLPKLLPKQLALAFNSLRGTAEREDKEAVLSGVTFESGNSTKSITMSVAPLKHKKDSPAVYLVTFKEDSASLTSQTQIGVYNETTEQEKYHESLEEKVQELTDSLHFAFEKLDTSNENMQSFNEELLSANEEMQSTNEEMQSVNEELHTINADYQLKNKELLELNDDLNNYFRSNVNGQLFIDSQLRLMKFSPGTVKQINLLDSDVGRPLSDISTNIKFETIIADLRQVLAEGTVITKEIETNNGKWYQITTMPSVESSTSKITGAIITFNDITALKYVQVELDKKNKSLQHINAELDNFVLAASHDLLAPLGNIEISIDLMKESAPSDSEQYKYLKIINSSVVKFRSLIQDIATIAKVEDDMVVLEQVGIKEVLDNIEWSLNNKILISGAIINRQLEVEQLFFSKKNLRSILFNLILNSLKFKGSGSPVIKIMTQKSGEDVVLSVEDNGIGIAQQNVNKIFDVYGRLHQDIEGQGIGLYLAKKIVTAAQGRIEVESVPGKGSKFSIYLRSEPVLV